MGEAQLAALEVARTKLKGKNVLTLKAGG